MKILTIAQFFVAILLSISILLQNRGSGLGAAYGDSFGGYYTKRGMEKFLFYFSIILAVVFVILALADVITGNK
jgi:preprotein translocase subunit SecG